LWSFVLLFPIWYVWTKKNLATLIRCLAQFSFSVRTTLLGYGRTKKWQQLKVLFYQFTDSAVPNGGGKA
jgi:hypothetical protein